MLKKKVWRIVIFIQVGFCFCPAIPEVVDCNDPETFSFQGGSCYYPLSTEPCEEGKWGVVTSSNMLACQTIPCEDSKVLFNGKCIHMYDTIACPAVVERLFLTSMAMVIVTVMMGGGGGKMGGAIKSLPGGSARKTQLSESDKKKVNVKQGPKKGATSLVPFHSFWTTRSTQLVQLAGGRRH